MTRERGEFWRVAGLSSGKVGKRDECPHGTPLLLYACCYSSRQASSCCCRLLVFLVFFLLLHLQAQGCAYSTSKHCVLICAICMSAKLSDSLIHMFRLQSLSPSCRYFGILPIFIFHVDQHFHLHVGPACRRRLSHFVVTLEHHGDEKVQQHNCHTHDENYQEKLATCGHRFVDWSGWKVRADRQQGDRAETEQRDKLRRHMEERRHREGLVW